MNHDLRYPPRFLHEATQYELTRRRSHAWLGWRLLLVACLGMANVRAQGGSGWEPLYRSAQDLRRATKGTGELVDGLAHLTKNAALWKQPSPHGAIKATIHVKEGTSYPGLLLRSTEDSSASYGARLGSLVNGAYGQIQVVHRGPQGEKFIAFKRLPKEVRAGDIVELEFAAHGSTLTVALAGTVCLTIRGQESG